MDGIICPGLKERNLAHCLIITDTGLSGCSLRVYGKPFTASLRLYKASCTDVALVVQMLTN